MERELFVSFHLAILLNVYKTWAKSVLSCCNSRVCDTTVQDHLTEPPCIAFHFIFHFYFKLFIQVKL